MGGGDGASPKADEHVRGEGHRSSCAPWFRRVKLGGEAFRRSSEPGAAADTEAQDVVRGEMRDAKRERLWTPQCLRARPPVVVLHQSSTLTRPP